MFGILSLQSSLQLMTENVEIGGGGTSNGGSVNPSSTAVTTNALVGENKPTQQFDISVLSGLRPGDKYLGRNRVSDIQESYQTYITGSPIGRGGKYAIDAARRYGTTLTEAARGYLVAAGLPTLASVFTPSTPVVEDSNGNGQFFPLPPPPNETPVTTPAKNPFEVLADILPNLFGNAVYNPPLQSQAYGYSPTTSEQPLQTSGGGGLNIGLFVIVGVIGVIAYFLYKRFAN